MKHNIKTWIDRNETNLSIGFFIGGFIFDLLLLDSIDSWSTIGQQAVYLVLVSFVLLQIFFEDPQSHLQRTNLSRIKQLYYDYRSPLIHFSFGSLLNSYTLFFFKSSSLTVSFIFLAAMVGLLIVNESHRFKKANLAFKFATLSLCYICFSACVTPVAIGSIGTFVVLFSMLLGGLPFVIVGWWIQRYRGSLFEKAKKEILVPMGLVLLSFVSLDALRLIPPVPLSLPFIGVYHSVEKTDPLINGAKYKLGHERPWWRFWNNGDQIFRAQRSDKIFVFFRLFSPSKFADSVILKWFWQDNARGWTLQDAIPIKIFGGREAGFRGFGVKSNYQPGEWKVQVETSDGREIGRVYFSLTTEPDSPRTLEYVWM